LAHANDPVLGDSRFQVEYRTDVYAEQRGLEHPDGGSDTASYGYDKLNRLVSESGLATTKSYNQDGSRLTKVEGATVRA
jgi:hypothetical protein